MLLCIGIGGYKMELNAFMIKVEGCSGNCPFTQVEVIKIKEKFREVLKEMSVDEVEIEVFQ
jgi:hypothetical protein